MNFQKILYFILFSYSFSISIDNPWIYTEHVKPEKKINFIASIGVGNANRYMETNGYNEPDNAQFFKYSILNKQNDGSYTGISYSAYIQQFERYNYWDMYNNKDYDNTSYMLSYTTLKSFKKNDTFKGLFYGYDVGITFISDKLNPFGIMIWAPVLEFFENDDRSDIGLGINLSLGYALDKSLFSFEFGYQFMDRKVAHYCLTYSYKNF